MFEAASTDDVAAVIQGGLQCRDSALRLLLGAGMVEAQLLPRGDMSYDEFSTVLAAEEGVVAAPILAEGTITTPPRAFRRAPTVAERPSAKRKTSAKAKKPVKKSPPKKKRPSTKKPSRKRKPTTTRRR